VALPVTGKVVLDTNVFVDYLRLGLHRDWVIGPSALAVRFLSAIVLMELRLGADTPPRRRAVDGIRDAFPARRVVAPAEELYDRAGTLFRRIHGTGSGDRLGSMNDLLIALTAWRIGATVVTANLADFRRIATHLPGLRLIAPLLA
jgi:predicted nucleic acid-binding protein